MMGLLEGCTYLYQAGFAPREAEFVWDLFATTGVLANASFRIPSANPMTNAAFRHGSGVFDLRVAAAAAGGEFYPAAKCTHWVSHVVQLVQTIIPACTLVESLFPSCRARILSTCSLAFAIPLFRCVP